MQPNFFADHRFSVTSLADKLNSYGKGVNKADNWYFLNPVNQRGASGTITDTGYFYDRWVLTDGSVRIASDGALVLDGTMEQRFERAFSGTLTASVLSTTGMNDAAASYDASNRKLTVTGTGQRIIAVKLELGTQQTLAHQDADGNWVLNDPPPNYQQELAKCQRYLPYVAKPIFNCIATGIATDNTTVMIGCPLPVTPVKRPVAVYSDLNAMYLLGKNYPSFGVKILIKTIDIYSGANDRNPLTCALTVANGYTLTPGEAYMFWIGISDESYFYLTSEL